MLAGQIEELRQNFKTLLKQFGSIVDQLNENFANINKVQAQEHYDNQVVIRTLLEVGIVKKEQLDAMHEVMLEEIQEYVRTRNETAEEGTPNPQPNTNDEGKVTVGQFGNSNAGVEGVRDEHRTITIPLEGTARVSGSSDRGSEDVVQAEPEKPRIE